MTPERRAELVARRAELRAARERRSALDKCLRYAHRATFTPEGFARIAAEVRVLKALGR